MQYIRHARRTKGISGAREVFKHARADLRIGHEVFVASALQELLSGAGDKGRKVCLNIFKLGMKSFSDHPGFIGAYLDFLFHMGDNNNTRAVFEQVLPTLPAEQAASLWARFVAFEGAYGNLDRVGGARLTRLYVAHAYLSGNHPARAHARTRTRAWMHAGCLLRPYHRRVLLDDETR